MNTILLWTVQAGRITEVMHRGCLGWQRPLVVGVWTCLWSEQQQGWMYNHYLLLKCSSKRDSFPEILSGKNVALSEKLRPVTWWTALVCSLTSADCSPYRQTSRRRTSPSHPQCRPLSAPARLHCVADSCTRPGSCHWKTSVVIMTSTVLKTI